MNDDVRTQSHSCLFQLEGELRADHVEGLRAMALAHVDPGCVLVDCRRVTTYLDGAFAALVELEQAVTARGGKVMLVGISHPDLRTGVLLETA